MEKGQRERRVSPPCHRLVAVPCLLGGTVWQETHVTKVVGKTLAQELLHPAEANAQPERPLLLLLLLPAEPHVVDHAGSQQ